MKNGPTRTQRLFLGILFIGLAVSIESGLAATSAQNASPVETSIENSVVRVFSTIQPPDFMKPWSKQPGREITGSGVVIEGRRILTNAHVVSYAGQIQIQGHQSGDKVSATIEAVAPGMDLAVLKLSDESFFDTHAALKKAEGMPSIKDSVMVYGFPTGGSNISITKGIVSRIDFAAYNYPATGLRVQIDAAINPGNSGGPAVVGDKLVGIAFSILSNSQNIGYIIPCEEIDLFLKDIADGRYDGKPAIYDEFQTLENPALRAFLKIDDSIKGIVAHTPFRTGKDYPLKQWDVITKIGNTPIDNQGSIQVNDSLKLPFASLVQTIAENGKVPMTVIREGREISIQLPVSTSRPKLIPYLHGEYPPYFICGPLVFSIAVEEMIAVLSGGNNGLMLMNLLSQTGSPLVTRRSDLPAFEGEELVMIPSPFFTHALAKNYSPPVMRIVTSINGISVKNLRHLVEILRDSEEEFIRIDLAGRGTETLVFRRHEMIAATEQILNDNGIRAQGSPDMLSVWERK